MVFRKSSSVDRKSSRSVLKTGGKTNGGGGKSSGGGGGGQSKKLEAWKRAHLENQLLVSVSEPTRVTKGRFRKKNKVLYVVRTTSKTNTHRVERSWKDFVALQEAIAFRFPGCVTPPLPPSKTTIAANTGEHFVTKRMHGLELFLQATAEHPYFRDDRAFGEFISSSTSFNRSLSRQTDSTPSMGVSKWGESLQQANRVADPYTLTHALQAEFTVIKAQLKSLKEAVHVHARRLQALALSNVDLAVAFKDWSFTERDSVALLSGEAFSPTANTPNGQVILADKITDMQEMTTAYAAVMHEEYGPSQLEAVLLDAIRFEFAFIKGWDDALSLILSKLNTCAKAQAVVNASEKELSGMTQKKENNQHQRWSKKINKVQKKLVGARLVLAEAEAESKNYQQGALSVEIYLYREARALRGEKLVDNFTRLHQRGIASLGKIFNGTGIEYGLDGNAIIKQSRRRKRNFGRGNKKGKRAARRLLGEDVGTSVTSAALDRKHRSIVMKELDEEALRHTQFDGKARGANADENHATLRVSVAYKAKRTDELDLAQDEILSGLRINESIWYATNRGGRSGIVQAEHVQVKASVVEDDVPSSGRLSSNMGTADGRATWAAREPPPGLFPMRAKPFVPATSRLSSSRPPTKPELPEGLRNSEAQQATRKLSALRMILPEQEAVDITDQSGQESDGGSYYSSSDYDDEDEYYNEEEDEEFESESSLRGRGQPSAPVSAPTRPQAPTPPTINPPKQAPKSAAAAPKQAFKAAPKTAPVTGRPPNPFGGGGIDLVSAIAGFKREGMATVKVDEDNPKQKPKRQDGPLSPLEELRQKLMTRPFVE